MSNATTVAALMGKRAYNEANKAAYKKAGMGLLRELVKTLGLAKGTYDLRYNPAGIACSGDCTLHADDVYVQFNADCCDWVLVRTCKGRKDYTGGTNRQYPFARLSEEGIDGLARFVQSVRGTRLAEIKAAAYPESFEVSPGRVNRGGCY